MLNIQYPRYRAQDLTTEKWEFFICHRISSRRLVILLCFYCYFIFLNKWVQCNAIAWIFPTRVIRTCHLWNALNEKKGGKKRSCPINIFFAFSQLQQQQVGPFPRKSQHTAGAWPNNVQLQRLDDFIRLKMSIDRIWGSQTAKCLVVMDRWISIPSRCTTGLFNNNTFSIPQNYNGKFTFGITSKLWPVGQTHTRTHTQVSTSIISWPNISQI